MPLLVSEGKARQIEALLRQGPAGPPPFPMSYRNDPLSGLLAINESGEEIPAFAIMQPTGAEITSGRIAATVIKWNGSYIGPFLFNGSQAIPDGKVGPVQCGPALRVLYDSSYTPAYGDCVGPIASSWKVKKGLDAARIIAAIDTDNKIAIAIWREPETTFIKAPSGGIPGRAGTLLGEATCDVWSTGTTSRTISDTGSNISVLNWSVSSACVNGDRYGMAGFWAGKWWIIAEDCANTAEGNNQSGTTSTTGSVVASPLGTSRSGSTVTIGRPETPEWAAPFEVAASPAPIEVE